MLSILRMAFSGHTASRTLMVKEEPLELKIALPVAVVDTMLAAWADSRQDRSRGLRSAMASVT